MRSLTLLLVLFTSAAQNSTGDHLPGTTVRVSEAEPDVLARPDLLEFDWPVGLKMNVRTVREKVRHTGSSVDSTANSLRYTLTVNHHPRGRHILYSDFSDPQPVPPEHSASEVLATVAALFPDYVVSEEGDLVSVQNLESIREEILGLVETEEDWDPDLDDLMANFLSAEILHQVVSQEWMRLVGAWVGLDLAVGEVLEFQGAEPVALFGGRQVPYNYRYERLASESCERDGDQRECAQILLVTEPDPRELGKALEIWLEGVSGSIAPGDTRSDIRVADVRIRNELLLVTEPEGLIPHEVWAERATEIDMIEDGERQTQSEIRRVISLFSFDR